MSRKYEGLIVLNTKGIDGSIDDLVSAIGKDIEADGGRLDEVQQLGHRKFAYPSNHIEGGHYVNYFFDADPEVIEKVTTRLKLNPNVHLQHYQVR